MSCSVPCPAGGRRTAFSHPTFANDVISAVVTAAPSRRFCILSPAGGDGSAPSLQYRFSTPSTQRHRNLLQPAEMSGTGSSSPPLSSTLSIFLPHCSHSGRGSPKSRSIPRACRHHCLNPVQKPSCPPWESKNHPSTRLLSYHHGFSPKSNVPGQSPNLFPGYNVALPSG